MKLGEGRSWIYIAFAVLSFVATFYTVSYFFNRSLPSIFVNLVPVQFLFISVLCLLFGIGYFKRNIISHFALLIIAISLFDFAFTPFVSFLALVFGNNLLHEGSLFWVVGFMLLEFFGILILIIPLSLGLLLIGSYFGRSSNLSWSVIIVIILLVIIASIFVALSMTKVAKAEVLERQAEVAQDPSICPKIDVVEVRDKCYNFMGQILKDLSYCDKISASTTDKISNSNLRDACYYNTAIDLRAVNISLCNKLIDLAAKDDCKRLASGKRTMFQSSYELDNCETDLCFYGVALKTYDPKHTICENIKNESMKTDCNNLDFGYSL
jgi:hypothetical protein